MSRASNGTFPFVGHYRCLDFVNTALIAAKGGSDPIQDFHGLVSWLHEAGLINAGERSVALEKWSKGREAQQVYAAALISFQFDGKRCREYIGLADNRDNRRMAQRLLRGIELELATGQFDYA